MVVLCRARERTVADLAREATEESLLAGVLVDVIRRYGATELDMRRLRSRGAILRGHGWVRKAWILPKRKAGCSERLWRKTPEW